MKKKIVNVFYIFAIVGALVGMFLLVRTEQFTNVDGKLVMNTPQPSPTPFTMEIIGIVAETPIKHNSVALVRVDVESTAFSPIIIDQPIFVQLDILALQLKKGDRIKLYCDGRGLATSPKEFGYCGWDNLIIK